MSKITRLFQVLLVCMLILFMFPMAVRANSAEPPSLVILVNNPPEDLSISLISNENQPKAKARRVAWEGYYAFYSRDLQVGREYIFEVTTAKESFECKVSKPLQHYNNAFTLDLSSRELTSGTSPFRSVLLVSMRLLLTLLLEGIVFWLFKFREKKSWLVFLVINLVTQGVLNIWLNIDGSLMPNYLVFGLIIGEVFVFLAELILFPIFMKGHKKSRIQICVFTANLISLIAGGAILSILPV